MREFRKLIKLLGRRPSEKQLSKQLLGKNDLPSVKDFVDSHVGNLKGNRTLKGMATSDYDTIQIVNKILEAKSPSNKVNRGSATNFFRSNILHQPSYIIKETGSIKVLISDINDFPRYKQFYEKQKNKSSMICIGGPAAEDQVLISSIIDQVRVRLDDILYITRDYRESNISHSAKQSHARHGNALNADEALSGHKLIPILLMRKLLGVDLEEVLEPDYTKIDVEFTIDPRKLRIYFGNELNWLKQEFKKMIGDLTEHDINRLESVLSQEILIAIEMQTGIAEAEE